MSPVFGFLRALGGKDILDNDLKNSGCQPPNAVCNVCGASFFYLCHLSRTHFEGLEE